ncbi:serpin family protein [Aureibaculum sp. 2210JD6-5]|uniref:serpin family protein n=1 Tax=Aureibaculum sp. 2210JD6-5 TaxID=3103957 RepID=UPI002AAE4D78|nr:serpin family protein [Aureibaculum sp. 2210JD6-5]MDY7394653.1 serpin family protein [Aureibaculum sp. 2210JD6-5]
MNRRHLFSLIFLTLVLFSCESETDEPLPDFNSIAKSGEIVESNNKFAFDLFKQVANEETKANFMISPVSASLALGMVYNGAENETKSAFNTVFNYGDASLEEVNLVNQNIIDQLTDNSSGSTFNIANSLWIENNFPVKDNFVDLNKQFYDAKVESLDFKDPKSVDIINNWVADKTQQKIPTIIDAIDPGMVLFAINALYFKSDWKYTFKEENTHKQPFYPENGTAADVDMMNMEQDLSFLSNDLFSSVILPYKNDKYKMMLFIPNEGKNVSDISAKMDQESWDSWLGQYYEAGVSLSMPKFTFDYETMLNDALKNLGLGVAFTDAADFSGLSDRPTKISFVKQKTFIEVNEKGTEAAAVTAVGIETTSAGQNIQLMLNRPFLFLITEKNTNSICFIGKVGLPEYE